MKNKNKKKNKTIILTGSSGIIGKSLKIFLKKKTSQFNFTWGFPKKKEYQKFKRNIRFKFCRLPDTSRW